MTQFKLPKPSFFKPGSLVFLGSGHNLIKDGKYYRCAKNSNHVCTSHTRRIKAESLERQFSRLGKTLYAKDLEPDKLMEKLMRENLCDMIFGVEEGSEGKDELADATISVMHQEVSAGKKIKKSDEKDFVENYINSLRADHPVMLFGYAFGMIRSFACDVSEAESGRSLAHFSKKIYITDKNEIHSIELERWAWYVFNVVIERNWPGFLASKNINVTNGPDELHKLNLTEAALQFGTEDFPEAIGENFLMPIVMMSKMKESVNFSLDNDMNTMNKALPELLNQYQNNPVLRVLFGAVPLIVNK
jgi:hypothetical protein